MTSTLNQRNASSHATSIDYLGVILEKGVTRMDPVKISGIKDWPTPKTVKDVRSFLSFCNFYRPFIRGFATVARPLNELTRKGCPMGMGHQATTGVRDPETPASQVNRY
jgi:hypothetical protein